MNNFCLLVLSTIISFASGAKDTELEFPKSNVLANKDYAVLFSTIRYTGSYVFLQKISGVSSAVDLGFLKKTYALEEKTELPGVKIENNFLKFVSLTKKLDLSKLYLGQIYDGNKYFQFKPNAAGTQEFERLVSFLVGEEKMALQQKWHNFLLPTAYASSLGDKIKSAAAIAGGIYAAAMAVSITTSGSVGGLFATGAIGAGFSLIGGALLWAGVAETAIKFGIRSWNGVSVVCLNNQLFLKKADGNLVPLEGPNSGVFQNAVAYFGHLEIGAAELATRKLMCNDAKAMAQINSNLKTAFIETSPNTLRGKTNQGAI